MDVGQKLRGWWVGGVWWWGEARWGGGSPAERRCQGNTVIECARCRLGQWPPPLIPLHGVPPHPPTHPQPRHAGTLRRPTDTSTMGGGYPGRCAWNLRSEWRIKEMSNVLKKKKKSEERSCPGVLGPPVRKLGVVTHQN